MVLDSAQKPLIMQNESFFKGKAKKNKCQLNNHFFF